MKDYIPAPAEAATPTLGHKLQHRTPKFWVTTASVLTLHANIWDDLQDSAGQGPGRLMQLATQFSAQRYLLVGALEARLRVHKAQTVVEYFALHSTATPQDSDGCALWIHEGIEYLPGHRITRQMCRVLHAEPARLIVTIRGHGLPINVIVLHAPHSRSKSRLQSPDVKVAEWVGTTLQLVRNTRL
eukprot:9040015-Pyramimonas_sp.AAC.1